ncbi:MAG: lytic transglycosylase domain-containing protein [Sulfuricaulis sp.]
MYLLACAAAAQAQADIYAFADSQGIIHFTNMPSDPRYRSMTRLHYRASGHRRVPSSPAYRHDPGRFRPLVEQAAREHGIDSALLRAVIATESDYDPRAISPRGAVGLMQLMPDTARRYGVRDIYDPAENIQGGAKYLRALMTRFHDDLTLTLAAYNAGEDAIVQYGNRVPPYRETLLYVPRVMHLYRQYRRGGR